MLISSSEQCDCYRVISPNQPHTCNLCDRTLSACLYMTQLQHKITLQTLEIDQLKSDLQACEQHIRRQRMDFQHLNMKYVAHIDHVAEIQQQKEQADKELEELSTRLFEEANEMVACEKRKKHQLEELLRYTEDQLGTEQSQLYELRNRIEEATAFGDVVIRNDSGMILPDKKDETATNQVVKVSQTHVTRKITNKHAAAGNNENASSSNNLQLDHFRKFIMEQQNNNRNSIPSLISDRSCSCDEEDEEEVYNSFFQLHPTTETKSEYMTRCEIEDIEPCLQFGNSNSRLCIKTLMDQLAQKPCFIERITYEQAKRVPPPCSAVTTVYYRPIWERFSFLQGEDEETLTCAACSRRATLFYRFRMNENEDWLLIDQNCRDRLVAVCNFYSFIRNIQLGYYHRMVEDLYAENIELRLKMFYVR
jgi:hypothetical protein